MTLKLMSFRHGQSSPPSSIFHSVQGKTDTLKGMLLSCFFFSCWKHVSLKVCQAKSQRTELEEVGITNAVLTQTQCSVVVCARKVSQIQWSISFWELSSAFVIEVFQWRCHIQWHLDTKIETIWCEIVSRKFPLAAHSGNLVCCVLCCENSTC